MLLQGLLRCEACGRHMKITWAEKPSGAVFYFYRCGTHTKDRTRQPCRLADRATGRKSFVAAGAVEGAVWPAVGMTWMSAVSALSLGRVSLLGAEAERMTDSGVVLGPISAGRVRTAVCSSASSSRSWAVWAFFWAMGSRLGGGGSVAGRLRPAGVNRVSGSSIPRWRVRGA